MMKKKRAEEGQEEGDLEIVVSNYFNFGGDDSDDSDYVIKIMDDEGSYFSQENRIWDESEENEQNEDVIGGCVEGEVSGEKDEPDETEDGNKEHEQDETVKIVCNRKMDENYSVYESDDDVRYNDVVYPDTPYDTNDEWFELEKEDRKRMFEPKNIGKDRFYSGQKFPDKWELLDAVFWYSMKIEYNIMFYKRSKNKIGAKCSNLSCPWCLYSSIHAAAGAWRVRVFFSTHTCNKTSSTKILKVWSIASLFRETIRRIPAFKACEMRDKIIERWHMNVTMPQCIAARRKAVAEIIGDLSHQFSRLYDYELEIQRSNHGTTIEVGTVLNDNGKEVFQRFYVCFARVKTAWMSHCRKVIGLDGAFLKWTVKGEVLAAIGRDGNNRIFPIAWAVVDVKNTEIWDWFIMKLRCDLQLGEGEGLTLLTDKQKGFVKAIAARLPLVEHRMCAKHIYANWKKKHSDDVLKTMFWKIASSYNEATLNENWQKLLSNQSSCI